MYDIKEFDQDLADLQEVVSLVEQIDLNDIEIVKEYRLKLKKARTAITKKGKALREDSNAYSKAVIEREKELIAVIEPVEDKLESIEEKAEREKLCELRKVYIKDRRLVLGTIGDKIEISDENLCMLDDEEFDKYVSSRRAEKVKSDFLSANGYVEGSMFKIVEENGEIKLYKLVNSYTK